MAKRYDTASEDVLLHIKTLRKKHYDYLEGVTIGALFVSDEDGVPCLEHQGYPAAADLTRKRQTVPDSVDG